MMVRAITLGYVAYSTSKYFGGAGSGALFSRHPDCGGVESGIYQCPGIVNSVMDQSCNHYDDASLQCFGE